MRMGHAYSGSGGTRRAFCRPELSCIVTVPECEAGETEYAGEVGIGEGEEGETWENLPS